MMESVGEFIAELASGTYQDDADGENRNSFHPFAPLPVDCRVICLPAKDKADEVTAAMLAQLLESQGIPAVCLPATRLPAATLDEISIQQSDIVCISALPPFAVLNARSLSKKVRERFPCSKFLVGLWSASGGDPKTEERIEKAFPGEVVTTLAAAVEAVRKLVQSAPLCPTP
jgi:hypothetical protein